MNIANSIAPTNLRDYAKARDWKLVESAVKHRLYVMRKNSRELAFPMDITAPDYRESVWLMLHKLSEIEHESIPHLIANIQEIRSDTLRFRITTDRDEEDSIPLTFAASIIEGAQEALLAAACSVLKAQPHHPRLSRSEAQQLLQATNMGQTEHGSFILKVSCPVEALDVVAPLLPGQLDAPFVRRTTLALNQSLSELVTAIESDSIDSLLATAKIGSNLSSNLCEAIVHLHDEKIKNSVEVNFTWAAIKPLPSTFNQRAIRIQRDYFPRIEEIRRELRSFEKDRTDTFIGTVERLDGEMGDDKRRSGEVILALLLPEGERVSARLNLNPDQYGLADKAHMNDGVYIRVAGKLQPGRQPRPLTEVSNFELLSPGLIPDRT